MSEKFDFRLHDEIGRSSRSQVYKGRRRNTIEYYAVKSVDKKRRNRVSRQVKALHSLSPHPNIVQFVNWYETTRHFWVILEQCVGGNLLQVISKNKRLPEETIRVFGKHIVRGLQHIHSRGLIFCDIKPSNILIDDNGVLKFGGFGNARRIEDINEKSEDEIGTATPYYMAPELFIGAPYSTKSDMWSLGCVLYHMASGHPPYYTGRARDLADVLHVILSETPAPLKWVSEGFASMIDRLLDKNPATRMGWNEFLGHPFWNGDIKVVQIPKESLFDNYVREKKLLPDSHETHGSRKQADERAKAMRESVDVMRLSQIVQSNLESEMNDNATPDAEITADNQVHLMNADAEVDFRERSEEGSGGDDTQQLGSKENKSPSCTPSSNQIRGQRPHGQKDTFNLPMPPNGKGSNSIQKSPFAQRHLPLPTSKMMAASPSSHVQRLNSISEKRNWRQPSQVMKENNPGLEDKDRTLNKNSLLQQKQVQPRQQQSQIQKQQQQQQQQCVDPIDTKKPSKNGSQRAETMVNGDKPRSVPRNRAPSVTDLVFHDVDSTVRPIVANKRIERLPPPQFDQNAIPFPIKSPSALNESDQVEQDAIAKKIANNIISKSGHLHQHQVNVLSYLEHLASSQILANKFLASDIVNSLLEILRTSKVIQVQVKALTTLGLLIRHSTFMPEHLAEESFVEMLVQAIRSNHPKVQARAMACLGELLFYIASQYNHTVSTDIWRVPDVVPHAVSGVLDSGVDSITMHYAIKTLENLATKRSLSWVRKFANEGILHRLMNIYQNDQTEDHVREAAASTVVRLLRVNQQLVPEFMMQHGAALVSKGLLDGSSRMQIVALNVLNLCLMQQSLREKVISWLSEDQVVIPTLLKLLNFQTQVLWVKALASILLLSRYSLEFFIEACHNKLIASLERLSRDRTKGTIEPLSLAKREIKRRVPELLHEVALELETQRERASSGNETPNLSAAVLRLEVLQGLLLCSFLGERVVTKELICGVTTILEQVTIIHDKLSGVQEFRNSLLNTIDAICQCSNAVSKHYESILGNLLPEIAKLMESTDDEARFHCLKITHDILQMLISVPSIYGAHTTPEERKEKKIHRSREKIDSFARRHILPKVPAFLGDVELIPLFTIKILCCLLENNTDYMQDMEELNILKDLFRILSFENNCNSVHSVKLCRYLVEYTSLSIKTLHNIRAVEKVSKFLKDTYSNNVPQFFEPVLELCAALIRAEGNSKGFKKKCSDHLAMERETRNEFQKHEDGHGSQHTQCIAFLSDLDILIDLLSHTDTAVCLDAAICFEALAKMFPNEARRQGALSEKNCTLMIDFFSSAQENRKPTSAQRQVLQELGRTVGFWKLAESKDVSNLARKVESMLQLSRDAK